MQILEMRAYLIGDLFLPDFCAYFSANLPAHSSSMSRKRRNVGAPPDAGYTNPLSRGEVSDRNDGGGRRRYAYDEEDEWKTDMYESTAEKKSISVRKGRNQQTEVLVGNLDKELDEDDVETIFDKLDYGNKVLSVTLNYDRNGKSTGTAIVLFKTAISAAKCVKECNGILVDEKEMSLKIVGGTPFSGDNSQGPTARGGLFGSAFQGDDEPRSRGRGRGSGTRGIRNGGGSRNGGGYSSRGDRRAPRGRGSRGTRGRGRGRGRGRQRRNARNDGDDVKKSSVDLDKELEAYMNKKSGRGGGGGGGKKGKTSKSVEDLDAELDNYAKLAQAKKAKTSEE
ncbi:hypothetical protein AAMO2058_001393200 [Amorphochlora amoebiformis]